MFVLSFFTDGFRVWKELLIHDLPVIMICNVIFWIGYARIRKPQLADISWVANHFLIGLCIATHHFKDFSFLTSPRQLLYFLILTAWSIRLAGFLYFSRIKSNYFDPRFEMISKWTKHRKLFFFFQYQGQGFVTLVTGLPLYFIFNKKDDSFALHDLVALSLLAIGMVGQTLADQQLWNFKKKVGGDKKQIFRGGFWQKSRHPNLFFDELNWIGFAIAGLDFSNLSGSCWGLLGPIVLLLGMTFGTCPITDLHMKQSKDNYDQMVKETNFYVPF